MDREKILKWVLQHFGTEPDYPFKEPSAVLRHPHNRKWYGIVIRVSKNKLGLTGDEPVDILNIKCDPILIGSLRKKPGFHPAYHMNKDLWISLRLDGSVAEDDVKSLLAMSYELTK